MEQLLRGIVRALEQGEREVEQPKVTLAMFGLVSMNVRAAELRLAVHRIGGAIMPIIGTRATNRPEADGQLT